jgi:hypothetical protein
MKSVSESLTCWISIGNSLLVVNFRRLAVFVAGFMYAFRGLCIQLWVAIHELLLPCPGPGKICHGSCTGPDSPRIVRGMARFAPFQSTIEVVVSTAHCDDSQAVYG